MKPFTSILVDVDANAAAQPALDRAAAVARCGGARLRIVDVQSDLGQARRHLRADMEDQLANRRHQQLERIADGLRDLPVETDLLTGPPANALIRDVLRFNHDLLVRSHVRDLVEDRPAQFSEVDAELLRYCPCPVWAVGPGVAPQSPKIVAAVDASVEDPLKQRLNVKIVELTLLLAALLEGTAKLLHVWRPFSEQLVHSYATNDEFSAYLGRTRAQAHQDLARLGRPYEFTGVNLQLELRRGDVAAVIPQFVVAEGVDLVVLGCTGRGGIVRRLMGSTAERVFRKLPCSLVVVKPDGFVSPVRLSESA